MLSLSLLHTKFQCLFFGLCYELLQHFFTILNCFLESVSRLLVAFVAPLFNTIKLVLIVAITYIFQSIYLNINLDRHILSIFWYVHRQSFCQMFYCLFNQLLTNHVYRKMKYNSTKPSHQAIYCWHKLISLTQQLS